METTTRPRPARRYVSWLIWGALTASLVAAALFATRVRATRAPAAGAAQSEEMKDQIQRLQEQVSQLQRGARAAHTRHAKQERLLENGTEKPITAEKSVEETPDLSEEALIEREKQANDKRQASLEQRFTAEPVDADRSRADELSLRRRIEATAGYELLKVECRTTLCRLEVKSDTASAMSVIGALGLEQGGDVRRRDDGTFLVFAGRADFPFQELHAVQ